MKRTYNNRYPVTVSGTSVEVYDDDFNKALRRFTKKAKDAGIVKECKDRQHYEKPSSVKQRKQKAARKRWEKKQSKLNPTKK